MNFKRLFVAAFPIVLALVLIIGYCLEGIVGPNMCWPYALMIVLLIGSSMLLPPDDPETE